MRKTAADKEALLVQEGPEIVTLGCRLNAYESAQMQALAKGASVDNAVVINTCAVTNEAVRQARQTIRKTRKNQPDAQIIVTGCAAQIDPKSFSEMAEVDAVIGNSEKLDQKSWAALGIGAKNQVSDIMAATTVIRADLPKPPNQARARAHVQVQNGCDHRCTFCIIPFGRGNSRSVTPSDAVKEIQDIVRTGTKEIVITGVDITSWGADLPEQPVLGDLIYRILNDVPDLHRLRLSSIDGAEIDTRLFDLITTNERIAPHIHLSLQAGDDMILKRMKRRHTRAQAIEICTRIKTVRPDVAFGADIIAGFPTETDEMFENSMRLVEECSLSYLHVFPYSARAGTPAEKMPQVNGATIKERARRLRAAGDAALSTLLDSLVGKDMELLTEAARKDQQEEGRGRLANFAEVTFAIEEDTTALLPGQLRRVHLVEHNDQRLRARLIEAKKDKA